MPVTLKVKPLALDGAAEIEIVPFDDVRGRFARLFCQEALRSVNCEHRIEQINYSMTVKKATVRGMHFQCPPKAEDKMVRCLRGQIFDVMVDLRKESPTFGQWQSLVLDADRMNMVYIPRGFAHGFQTLADDCELLYLHTESYSPDHEGGVRYDSPALAIKWPLPAMDVSERDLNLPVFDNCSHGIVL